MSAPTAQIIYTYTDEAPALATRSLLPILQAYFAAVGVAIETRDISLAGRILANFPEKLSDDQRLPDALSELGELAKTPQANIIKLPNISASIPQLCEAIAELQSKGFDVPDYPVDASTDEQKSIRDRYAKVLGSAVNPVLREGNSDRRVAGPVKEYAKKHPHSMGDWSPESNTNVASMGSGDFYDSEQSHVMTSAGKVRIEWSNDSQTKTLKEGLSLQVGEIIDAAVMQRDKLRAFFAGAIEFALGEGLLMSLHLKATMMKVSDPIIFGHCVSIFYEPVLQKHADDLAAIGFNPNNGIGDLYAKLPLLAPEKQSAIEADISSLYLSRPPLAMVDSDKGITNLHVPSDVIIDASMPAAIRSSGRMWNPDGKLQDTLAIIPDRCYAGVYQATIDFCKANGAFDVSSMGSVANVGLMAQKAEEYGSHDKTFQIPADGTVRVIDDSGAVLMEHDVAAGDIWRMCQTKDLPIRDWVKLAVSRARATGTPAIFWLDEKRAHDANLIAKVTAYLHDHDTDGLEIAIMAPEDATTYTCQRCKEGKDTISVTGNVLRDYLTDLFPILELGTSAKMLSIVPLLAGGGLFETGAGGSAPKHVEQLVTENHLRWDSLGEFLAIAVSLEDLAAKTNNDDIAVLAQTLNTATSMLLGHNKSPGRSVGELDNRGSQFYLAMYWAQALASQSRSDRLKSAFTELAKQLTDNEAKIVDELKAAQGSPVDVGGYYRMDDAKVSAVMRPSESFNAAIAALV